MKKVLTNLIENMPDVFKNIGDWVKGNFEENGKELLDNSNGTIGILIKFFGKNLIDSYFDKLEKNKLDNFGEITYLKAAYKQANKSIETIESDLNGILDPKDFALYFSEILNSDLKTFNSNQVLLIFQPEYHPSIIFVKNNYVNLLKKLGIQANVINSFLNDFNLNISNEVESTFGDSYPEHLNQISDYLFQKNEAKFLWETSQLEKIGFDSNENLQYEETYASWEDLNNLQNFNIEELQDKDEEPYETQEKNLKPIETLINQYFNDDPDSHLEKILFIIADFGKGKTIFLKHYAAKLAKNYIETREGLFPIYFNLRNFSNYNPNTKLGIIEDFLLTDFAIDIKSDHFSKKQYLFLIDSLDESCELNKINIEKVINSVKQIQNIDKSKFRTNKIIITSRPFDDGLNQQLRSHKPKTRLNSQSREIIQYLSIYGFKKDQFNRWLSNTIKSSSNIKNHNSSDIINKIIKSHSDYDIYAELIENRTLSKSELRRPIFAYMIYQLIINEVNFLEAGKIGVYLSFLNLLSRDAKYINDPNYTVNLNEEFEYRNLLHAISSLWMFERHQGKQGSLTKADICRVLDGTNKHESDNEVLQRYKEQGVNEITFLSHSYFGENDNKLHFQHQSFAEILLAEYYLKVFIKYSLDEDFNIEEARTKLILGMPTDQTMNFFIDLLTLLKDSANEIKTKDVIEKRKLLFPLLASLATKKNNGLFCNDIYYEWFKKCNITPNESSYPDHLINNWYFNDKKINRILLLCKEIINSNNTYLLCKGESKTALYNNELTLLQNTKIQELTLDFDRWLALLVGNRLCNQIENNPPILFNTKYEISPSQIFDLIIQSANRKINTNNIPIWGRDLFMGIDMSKSNSHYSLFTILSNLNFSFSHLKNLDLSGCLLGNTKFNNIILENVDFSHSYMWGTRFKKIISIENPMFNHVVISDFLIPFSLMPYRGNFNQGHIPYDQLRIPDIELQKNRKYQYIYVDDILNITAELFSYLYSKKLISIKSINKLIQFESEKMKKTYLKKIKDLANEYSER